MQPWRRRTFFLFLLPLLLCAAGCPSRRTDLLEAELRNRELLYESALNDQRRSEARVESMQREIEALRQGNKLTPEQAAQTFGLKRIALGRSTGGYDRDGLPGDELLQVIVEPRDCDDHTIKAPGTLQIFTFEINPQGIKIPLSSWEIAPDKVRQSWKQGLLSTGYTLTLPWRNFPQYENVRVVARFVTPDQRVYEADKDVKVRIVPGAALKRCAPTPDTLPVPNPLPLPETGPNLLPTDETTRSFSSPNLPPATEWRSTTPRNTVTIGRPEPIDSPGSPPPLRTLEDFLRQ